MFPAAGQLDLGARELISFPRLSVGNSQISNGVSVGGYAVLVITGLCTLAAAMLAFRRLDIH
jgi:hypothetical protein